MPAARGACRTVLFRQEGERFSGLKGRCLSRRIGGVTESANSLKKGVDITLCRAYNIHVDLKRGINSVVECHLAKVKVASSNLVSRSKSKAVSSETAFLLFLVNPYERIRFSIYVMFSKTKDQAFFTLSISLFGFPLTFL